MEAIPRGDTTEGVIYLTEALNLLLILRLSMLKQKILDHWVEMGLCDLLTQVLFIKSLQVGWVPLHAHFQLHQQRIQLLSNLTIRTALNILYAPGNINEQVELLNFQISNKVKCFFLHLLLKSYRFKVKADPQFFKVLTVTQLSFPHFLMNKFLRPDLALLLRFLLYLVESLEPLTNLHRRQRVILLSQRLANVKYLSSVA